MLRGARLAIGSPSRKVDWIYVDDVVAGLLAVGTRPGLEGKSIDLGSGQLVEIREIVGRIRALVNDGSEIEFAAGAARPFEQVRCAEVDAAHALTGWRPAVSLDTGLARTVDFYKRQFSSGEPSARCTPAL